MEDWPGQQCGSLCGQYTGGSTSEKTTESKQCPPSLCSSFPCVFKDDGYFGSILKMVFFKSIPCYYNVLFNGTHVRGSREIASAILVVSPRGSINGGAF